MEKVRKIEKKKGKQTEKVQVRNLHEYDNICNRK